MPALRAAAPLLLLVAAMASIQCGAALAKSLFAILDPAAVTALRIGLAAAILLIVWRPWTFPPGRDAWRWIILYGLALGVMNLLFYMSIARIPLGVAVALEFTGPLTVAMLSSRRPVDFLWVALAGAGVVMLTPLIDFGADLDGLGVLLALGAGACWAFYIVVGQKAGRDRPGQAAALGMAVAALIALPVGVATAGSSLLNAAILPAALAVAVLSSALPYSMEMFALKRLDRRVFGIAMSLEPAIAAIAGFLLLAERLHLAQAAAIGCVVAASVGSAVSNRSTKPVDL
jgi:inner membrane transporter RhtA